MIETPILDPCEHGFKIKGVFKKGRPWNAIGFNKNNVKYVRWVRGVKKSPKVIEAPAPKAVTVEAPATNGQETLNLKLYVHIMRDITMNVKGVRMSNEHISKDTIEDKVMPELNKIWGQADIAWDLIEVYYENVLKNGYK